jgi:uncharacterized protein
MIASVLEAALRSGELSVARGPELLPVLRESGVVDAGGYGLTVMFAGVIAALRGADAPALAHHAPARITHPQHESMTFRYCTNFAVTGEGLDPSAWNEPLERLGDSVLVVGDSHTVKVHLHTDEPGRALSLGTAVGVLEEVDVKNMHAQTLDRKERLSVAEARAAVVAVCSGAGTTRLFESLGALCVEGGQSMNPATADIVAAVEAAGMDEVVVLPNNKNVLLAAEQAAGACTKSVRVVPTRSLQAGLGAMVAFEPSRSAEENAAEMEDAAAGVRAGAVTRASRTTTLGALAIEEGQFLGLVDEEPVTSGPALAPVAREVAERLLGEATDVLTILSGAEAEGVDELAEALRDAHPELEVEVHDGGQPHYPLLFSAE